MLVHGDAGNAIDVSRSARSESDEERSPARAEPHHEVNNRRERRATGQESAVAIVGSSPHERVRPEEERGHSRDAVAEPKATGYEQGDPPATRVMRCATAWP
jgi:hypothetical protein